MEGYEVAGPASSLVGSLEGRLAIVVGGAEGGYKECEWARRVYEDPVIFAANDIGCYLPVVHHWVSLHYDKLEHWAALRRLDGSLWQDFKTHCNYFQIAQADYVWSIEPCHFSLSGYFAMQLAYLMGADRIILAGCPGSRARRFFEPEPRSDSYGYGGGDTVADSRDREQLCKEMSRVPSMKEKVRSMSGWSKEYFGGPDD